ncbi:MAG: threonine--tRNA ligase [Candidatus Tectomicrobia bacterium]|nr:threonine--tRNA ligase [Candidatus Tectomicrobia bacterium]
MAEAPASEQDRLYRVRHSIAHIMAQAVLERYPEAGVGIGPPIENGFYYDFDLGTGDDGRPRTFTPEDLEQIEARMRELIAGRHPFVYRELTPEDARETFQQQTYKLELIEGALQGGIDEYGNESDETPIISAYRHDAFEDFCRGPHVEHGGQIPPDAFKLMSVAGAYWRGSEHNPMLQRIYGTAWLRKKDLQEHLKMLEEAKQRDHRKLGRELELFTFDDEVGPGLPLWQPRGAAIIEELEKLAKEMEFQAGYDRVRTPHLSKDALFERSGHLSHYTDSMFPPMQMDGLDYYVKPMNCPFHNKIYASKPRSYRDLPLRLAEYGTCYRYEQSGELYGLMRVRSMQMNDAHIYCTEEQFEAEFLAVIDMYQEYFRLFNIDKFFMRLSTHHKRGLGIKYVDNERLWHKTEDMVRSAMKRSGMPYEEVPDEAAFYGPKIDVQGWSVIGREFSLATNQVDFVLPERFNLTFVNREGQEETPLCIHRAPLGTHERTIGFLIEHYAGNFPVWLSPEQVRVIPIADAHHDFATDIAARLRKVGIRAGADLSNERMNRKIREAQLMKVPYMPVVGDREMEQGNVSLRKRDRSPQETFSVEAFIDFVQDKISSRSSEL